MSFFSKAVKSVTGSIGSVFGVSGGLEGLWNDFTGKTAVDQQNAYNLQMWNMQNAYNTPANQVARLRAAGLNPNLFYSQGNVGNASSAPEMTAHQGSAAKALGLLTTAIGLKGQLEGQALEKAKTLSSIEHSKDVLEFEKRQALVNEAFRDLELKQREKEFGWRVSVKDRDYQLAKERLDFERSKPYGGAIGFADRIMHSMTGQHTTDVASDVGNALGSAFYNVFDGSMRGYRASKDLMSYLLSGLKGIRY